MQLTNDYHSNQITSNENGTGHNAEGERPYTSETAVQASENQQLAAQLHQMKLELAQAKQAHELSQKNMTLLYHLSQMINEPESHIQDFALEAAVQITNSTIGYIYLVNEDETLLSLYAWSKSVMPVCRIMEPQTEYEVARTGLWGEAVRQRKPIITNDYLAENPFKKGYPEGHVQLFRHMNIPLIEKGKIVLLAGVGNKDNPYDEQDVQSLTVLMETMWRLVQKKRTEIKLRDSESRYHAVFEQAGDSIFLVNPQTHQFVDFNDQFPKLLGYTREEFAQLILDDIEANETAEEISQHVQHVNQLGGDVFESRLRHKSGELLDVLVNTRLVQTKQDAYLISVVRDNTAPKQASRLLELQRDLAIQMSISKNLDEMLACVLNVVMEFSGVDAGAIHLVNTNRAVFDLLAYRGLPPDVLNDLQQVSITHIAESELLKGIPAFGPFSEVRPLPNRNERMPYQACAILPIQFDGQTIGVLSVVSLNQESFSPLVSQTLQVIAGQIGGPIMLTMAQDELMQTRLRYQDLVETIDGIVWESDPETFTFRFVSSKAEQLLGYPVAQWLEPGFWVKHVHPDDLAWASAYCVQKTQQGEDHRFEYRMLAADGRIVWLHDLVNVLQENGRPTKLRGVMVDITARKEAEKTVMQLSRAVQQSPVSIVITDVNGNIEYVNPKFEQITGYQLHEALGQNPRILNAHSQPASVYENLWRTISSGHEWHGELHNRKKNGEKLWEYASISPILDKDGQITHYVAVKEDITQQRHMQEQLAQRNQELQLLNKASQTINSSLHLDVVLNTMLEETRALFGVIACSVWLYDEAANQLVCRQATNPQSAVVVGWRLSPGQGIAGWVAQHNQSVIVDNVREDERHFKGVDNKTGLQIASILSVPLVTSRGMTGVFQLVDERIGRFNQRDLQLVEALAAVAANAIENAHLHQDLQNQLTQLKEAKMRLVQSEKLAAVGELIAGVAHELNNPLASIMLHAQLMQARGVRDETKRDLEHIVTQSKRANNVVRGLLDFARQHPPEQTPTQINDVLKSTLDLLSYELRTHNVSLFTQLQLLPMTLVDPHQLQQVFVNLINNALHAMQAAQDGGSLSIYSEVGVPQFYHDATHNEPVIRIMIEDNGPGIPPENQARIFDPFFTTKRTGEGTGLGLSVCHGIISEHGGHIWVESEVGQGSTFIIELPILQGKVDDPAPFLADDGDELAAEEAQERRILVLDDELSVLTIMTRILRRHGYEVDARSNALEGLTLLDHTTYDLILCDLRMPGMGGKEFYRHLGEKHPEMVKHIIFTTGDTLNGSTRTFLDEVEAAYLSKPFEMTQLVEVVKNHWRGHDADAPLN